MPNVMIATRAGWLDHKPSVIDAVHAAMIEALKIPKWDRTLRVVEYAPDAFAVPPSAGPRYTLIEITLFSGRSSEAKKQLYRALVRNLELVGVPPGDVKVVLIEVPLENWGIRGGQPASEVDLGFEVSI